MSRIQLSTVDWDRFWNKAWAHVTAEVPDAKRMAMRNAALEMAKVLYGQIGRRVNDLHGHVIRWQDPRVGSGGGYAAVSPVSEPVGDSSLDSRGITYALEFGHGVRLPSGKAKRYTYRGTGRNYVPGRQFYSYAKSEIANERIVERAAERVLVELENAFDL